MAKAKDPRVIDKKSEVNGMIGDYKAPRYDGSLESMVQLIREPSERPGDARTRVIELLRGEEDMEKLVETFDLMRKRGDSIAASLDSVVQRAGVNRSDAFGAISRVLHRYNFDVTRLVISTVAAQQAGRVAMAMANRAAHPDGISDRRLFMEVAKANEKTGGGFTVNVPVNNTAIAQARADSEGVNPGGRELPRFEDGIKQLSSALRVLPEISSKAG